MGYIGIGGGGKPIGGKNGVSIFGKNMNDGSGGLGLLLRITIFLCPWSLFVFLSLVFSRDSSLVPELLLSLLSPDVELELELESNKLSSSVIRSNLLLRPFFFFLLDFQYLCDRLVGFLIKVGAFSLLLVIIGSSLVSFMT